MSFLQRFTNYDVYERHTVVRDLLNGVLGEGSGATVLDVGGRRGLLAAYVPYAVTAVNPDGTGDETVDGTVLPYALAALMRWSPSTRWSTCRRRSARRSCVCATTWRGACSS